ncbi:MAG: FecR domain-containing protein, partial [Betaproteobacteria bacterium]
MSHQVCRLFAGGLALLVALPVFADSVGQVKVSSGAVSIERAGQRLPGPVGTNVEASDHIVTGADGSAGITFVDNSRLSVGPNSTLAISRFNFNPTTHEGNFDTALKRGTLSVISGKLAKRSPDAMTVTTPSTILGVRGTEFVVQAGE